MRRFKRGIARLVLSTAIGAAMLGSMVGANATGVSNKYDAVIADRVSRPAKPGNKHSKIRLIVQFTAAPTAAQESALKALGADIYRRLPIIHSAAMSLPVRNTCRLAALPYVRHISADSAVAKCDEFTVGHSCADVAYGQYGVDGTGVTVAVIDSGIHLGNDLKDKKGASRLVAQVSFVNGQSPDDACGHGTHVAGIIAGNGVNSTGSGYYRTFYGIARNTPLVNVRVLDQTGQGNVSDVLAGIQWVVANRSKYKIRVVNLSLGHPVGESYTTDPLCLAVEAAVNSGIVVVCAAGNDGRLTPTVSPNVTDNEGYGAAYGSIQSPANDPLVITVGAMKIPGNGNGNGSANRNADKIATYSSRGPSRLDFVLKPDIVAPGNQVISLDADGSYLDNYAGNANDIRNREYKTHGDNKWSNTYFRLSGTSMAAPVVAGAAALMLQANPQLDPNTVKARLMISADKWNGQDGTADPCTYGAGYINIPAALQCTVVATQPAISPSLVQNADGSVTVDESRILWGTSTASRVIWGASGVNDLRVVWGSRVIWGSSANVLSASRVIWGASVWGDRVIWGASSSSVDLTSTAINGEQ